MTSATSYKAAWTVDETLAEVRAGSGSQFDPKIVKAFLALVDEGSIELGTK